MTHPTQYSRATGAAAIAHSVTVANYPWEILSVEVHLSAGGAATDLTVTRNALAGAAYDTVLTAQAMSGLTSFSENYEQPLQMAPGDALDVAYNNGGAATYGSTISYRLVERET